MITALSSISLHFEYDLVAVRRRARQIAALVGFEDQDQTRIATVASEIARNALRYGGGGRIEFAVETVSGTGALMMTVSDQGPGTRTDMGTGINGARRLMDDLQISTSPGKGTTVTLRKLLPSGAPELTSDGLKRLMDELARQRPESPLEEIQQQNAELLNALAELEDANRSVVALRTPVGAILALTRQLEKAPLAEESKRQLGLIRRAAEELESLLGTEKPMRILIVDDDETARYTLANFATRPGAEIVEAENGLHGIARAVSDQPDVILLDLMMPGVGGHEVLARLKSDPATARIPVIIVTSRFVNDDERRQILTRASNVVYKGDLSRDTVSRAIADAMGAPSGH